MWVRSLGWEGPLPEGMATHSSILVWRIPWAEEPGGLQSKGLQRVGHDRVNEQQRGCLGAQVLSHVRHFAVLWTVARQAPLLMGFPRQECWSGLPLPTPGDLPDPGIKHTSPVSPALPGRFFTTAPPGSPNPHRTVVISAFLSS